MSSAEKKKYKPQLIFKDKQIFLVNKPAGWVTLNVDTYSGETLEDWVVKNIQFSIEIRQFYEHPIELPQLKHL